MDQGSREDIVKALQTADSGMAYRAMLEIGVIEEQEEDYEPSAEEIEELCATIPDEDLAEAWTLAFKAQAVRHELTFKFDGAGVPMGIAADPYRRAMVEQAFVDEHHKQVTAPDYEPPRVITKRSGESNAS